MHVRTFATCFVTAATTVLLLTGCGQQQAASGQGSAQGASTQSAAQQPAAPSLDGNWRQVDKAEGEDAMVGIVDGNTIALYFHMQGEDWTYWVGSFEAPSSTAAYTWTSQADATNMQGMLCSQDSTKDFSYADGKISFDVTIQGDTAHVVMEQVSSESGLLAGVVSSGGAAPADATTKGLEIVNSGYSVSDGYVHYALAISNPNEGYAPMLTNINVVGRATDGTISFSDEWAVGTTLPGATTYWENQAGNGNVSNSDTIEFSVSVDDQYWHATSEKDDFYQISNVSTKTDDFGRLVTTGEITLTRDVTLDRINNAKAPMLVCVLKDANGKIVGGYSTFLQSELEVGKATPFEIDSLFEMGDYATAEVYANPWMM